MASPRVSVGSSFDSKGIEQAQRALKKFADESKTGMERFQDSMQRVGKQMSDIGAAMSKKVTLPLLGVGTAAFKVAMDFESSMTKIQSLVGFSATEVEAMGAEVRRLSGETAKAPKDLADALFFATSAGLGAADAIDAVEQAARASAIGLGDVQTIVDLTTSAMNAYGSDTLDAASATDALTMAVRLGKLEPAQLAGAMGSVLPVASAMGVSFEEVGAAFAAMSRTGTNASEAATQLRGILSTLLSPSQQSANALASIGLSVGDVQASLREDGLLATLEMLVGKLGGNATAAEAVFGNIRALSGVMDMLGGNVEATREVFAGMQNALGVTDEAFAIASDTAEFKFNQALTDVKLTLLDVGSVLLPIVSDMLEAFSGLIRKFSELDEGTQKALVYFGGFVALIGPVAVMLGKIATGIGLMARAFVILRTAMMAHPILAIAGVIGTVAAGVALFGGSSKEAAAEVDGLADSMRDLGRTDTLRNSLAELVRNNEDLALVVARSSMSMNDLEYAIESGAFASKEFQLQLEEAAEEVGIFDSRRIRPLTDSVTNLGNNFNTASEKADNITRALERAAENTANLNSMIFVADEATLEIINSFEELTVTVEDLGTATATTFTKMADASEVQMASLQDAMNKGVESFTKANDDMLSSADRFIEGLQQQTVLIARWGDNLAIVAFNTSVEFAEYLASMGVSGAELVDDLAGDLSALNQAFEEWQRRTEASSSAAAISVNTARLQIEADLAALRAGATGVGGFNVQTPSVVPSMPALLPFRQGGMVPGIQGQPMPILAHAGEFVLSADIVDAIRSGSPTRGLDAGVSDMPSGPSVVIENYTSVDRQDDEMLINMLEFAVRGGRL